MWLRYAVRLILVVCLAFSCSKRCESQGVSLNISSSAEGNASTLQEMKLVSEHSGWLLANQHLFWTDSLGKEWRELKSETSLSNGIDGAFFLSSAQGWTIAQYGSARSLFEIARTNDGGKIWQHVVLDVAFAEYEQYAGTAHLAFADSLHGWLILGLRSGSGFMPGKSFVTQDGGEHWRELPHPPVAAPMYFMDRWNGYLGPGVHAREIYRTTDGGEHWGKIVLADPSTSLSLETSRSSLPVFVDALHGRLLRTYASDNGSQTVQYASEDGGNSWTVDALSDANVETVVAGNGSVLHPAFPGTLSYEGKHATKSIRVRALHSSFSTSQLGLIQESGSQCVLSMGECTQTTALLSTVDGGRSFQEVASPAGIVLSSANSYKQSEKSWGSTSSNSLNTLSSLRSMSSGKNNTAYAIDVQGFDKCELMTTAQMQDWYTNSPFQVVGAYIGGSSAACPNPGWVSSWTTTVEAQGWGIIPIWVGPQAPASGSVTFDSYISTDPATALSQGKQEADSAFARAAAVGFGQGSVIMYDMEAYDRNNATAVAATQAFVNGWVSELHANGYLAAIYSSYPELSDWAASSSVTNPPDIIWFAYFFSSGVSCGTTCQTVYGVPGLSDTLWANHHRYRQTSNGFYHTYGTTVAQNIDEDWLDAVVDVGSSNTLSVAMDGAGTGTVSSSDSLIDCGTTCSADYLSGVDVTLTAVADLGSTFSSWSGCTSVSSTICNVTVASSSTVTATFEKVTKLTPTISWTPSASQASYGSALGAGVLDAVAYSLGSIVSGNYAYTATLQSSGATQVVTAATILFPGVYTLTVSFTPGTAALYNSASASITFTILPVSTVLALSSSVGANLSAGNSTTLSASLSPYASAGASASGSISFYDGVSLICTAIAMTQTGQASCTTASLNAGTHTFSAKYTGDAIFAASSASLVVVATGVAPTISFTVAGAHTYGDAGFTVAATSNSSGVISYSVVLGPASISGNVVTLTGAGSVVLQASQAAAGIYSAGTQQASFVVSAATPVMSFTIADHKNSDTSFQVAASSTSAGAITYAIVSGPATLSGSTLTLTGGSGTVAVLASQAATANESAAKITATFQVSLDFTFSASSSTTQSVTSGSSASYSFALTPIDSEGYPGSVSLSATGGPAGASYVFSPASVGAGDGAQSIALQVKTPAKSARHEARGRKLEYASVLLLSLLLMPLSSSVSRRRYRRCVFAGLMGIGAMSMSGCGAGEVHSSQTSALSYSITVTATAGSVAHAVTVTLMVE